MKKKYTLRFAAIVFVAGNFISNFSSAQIVRLTSGFDNYIGSVATVPAGWYFSWNSTSSPSYYFTAGNYGVAVPSYKFGITQDTLISPFFQSGDILWFWCKGQGAPFSVQNALAVLYSSDSVTWNALQYIDSLPVIGVTLSYNLPCSAHYLMFIYYRVSNNLAFDDVKVTKTDYSPIASAATTLNFMCAEDSICFFDMSTIAGCDSIASRIWNFGDSTPQDSSENPCHVFAQPGNYSVWLRVTASNGRIDSTSLTITIYPAPSAQFNYLNVSGTMVNFTDVSSITSGSIVSWYWDFGDLNYSSQQNPSPHLYSSIGNYYVCLTVTSNYGCHDTICDSVQVIGAGIENFNVLSSSITLGPNPATNEITVHITGLHTRLLPAEIYDVLGNKFSLIAAQKNDETFLYFLPSLASGFYFLKLNAEGERLAFKIFIKN